MTSANDRYNTRGAVISPAWLRPLWSLPMHRAVMKQMGQMSGTETVLDVGCGPAELLVSLHERWPGIRLEGIDPGVEALEVARKRLPDALFIEGIAESIPLPPASVDVAVSTLSLHHWLDQAAGVREVARVLRPGGRFILSDMAPPGWFAKLLGHGHVHASAGSLEALLDGAGLTVESSRSWGMFFRFVAGRKG